MKAVILAGLAVLGLAGCSHPPKPTRYIIDSGVSGWVKITYNRADAAELPVEDGFAVVRVRRDLRVATRNHMNPSFDGSEFYYQTTDGKRARISANDDKQRRLWGLEKTTDGGSEREVFFVGKSDQFTRVGPAAGDMNTGIMDFKLPTDETKKPADLLKVETSLPTK